jgi:hypothetical protein
MSSNGVGGVAYRLRAIFWVGLQPRSVRNDHYRWSTSGIGPEAPHKKQNGRLSPSVLVMRDTDCGNQKR